MRIKNGYVIIARTRNGGYIREHTIVAERILGRPLPEGAVVHHVNEDRMDNRPENLVICPDENYHRLLHQRMRAKKACGHANWLKCIHCKKYDDPANLHYRVRDKKNRPGQTMAYHLDCVRKHDRERYAANPDLKKKSAMKYYEKNKESINKKRQAKKNKVIK